MSRSSLKRLLAGTHDCVMAALAISLALWARYGDDVLGVDRVPLWIVSYAVVATVAFRLFGLGRGMWRFASIADLRAIVLAVSVAVLTHVVLFFLFDRLAEMPRSVPAIVWFVNVVLLGAPRLVYRVLKDGGGLGWRTRHGETAGSIDILLIGRAVDADRVIRSYGLDRSRSYKIHGIVELTAVKRGRGVRGTPIIGELDELEDIVARLARGGVNILSLVLASPNPERMQSLAAAAARLGLPLRRIAPTAITEGEPNLEAITLEDLLGRPPVALSLGEISALIADKVVVVTGAGGSIGSVLVQKIAARRPARIVLVDASELALYEIDGFLAREFPHVERGAVLANVRDEGRMRDLMIRERPALVFHAAALKHVPLVERNVCEGVLTNVLGTRNVADAASQAGACAVVVVSTDKAIRPSSVMGATKRVAEMYCQALDVHATECRFVTVRFGNVLGSSGSVVPLFRRQIESGGPVTVTHPEMRRYFMTIPEATELVLQAAASSVRDDAARGRICVLDMGKPVRIVDLAKTMIVLAGLRPDVDIEIAYTGLRPGEKMFEELFEAGETTERSAADGVFTATASFRDLDTVRRMIDQLVALAASGDDEATRLALAEIVPTLRDTESHGVDVGLEHAAAARRA